MDVTETFQSFFKESGLPIEAVYVLVVTFVFFVCTRLVQANASHIFALLVAGLVVAWVYQKTQNEIVDFASDMDVKMQALGDPENLHMDANIINLFYDILDWRIKNPNNFDLALKAVGNVLRIERNAQDLSLERCVDQFDIARDQCRLAMNLLHGFVYTLDHPILIKKLKNVLKRLEQLLERHMVVISKHCDNTERRKASTDIHTRFIEDFNGPFANDPAFGNNGAFEVY